MYLSRGRDETDEIPILETDRGSSGDLRTVRLFYNRFTGTEEAAQWGQVQNQLQRRNDLIPNLVETVKGFAAQEKEIFTSIAASREKPVGAKTPDETIKANEQSAALTSPDRREIPT